MHWGWQQEDVTCWKTCATSLSGGWCAAVIKASSCSQLPDGLVQVDKSCVVGGGGVGAQRYPQRVAEHELVSKDFPWCRKAEGMFK